MSKPQIILDPDFGVHNRDLAASAERLADEKVYKDLSTVCIRPTRGLISAKVVQSWENLQAPMNGKFLRMTPVGMEVGAAYNHCVQMCLDHPDLSKWKYVLTLEEDNVVPWDGLLKLLAAIEESKFDAVGGLYWTKGDLGQPMIYGDPAEPINFRPQPPIPGTLQECHGLGMGFTLFRMDVFKRLPPPWFVTVQDEGGLGTQDLYAFGAMRKAGMRVACDTRVKVGHYDADTDTTW